ncbi:MAG: hypothetical protein WC376_01915 [Candidatus Nanoarchaeia archaeon]|jgi:hypothetical protein
MEGIVRTQVNIPNLTVSAKELINFILERLEEMDYEALVKAYKFQKGKTPGELVQVQFIVTAKKFIDDYTVFLVDVEFTADNIKVSNPNGKKTLSGESKLVFTSKVDTDYDKRWRSNPFLFFLRKIYEKYVYYSRLIDLEDKAEDELFDLMDSVKSKLKVK